MTAADFVKKAPGPFALAITLGIVWAMFGEVPRLGQLAWSKDVDPKIQKAIEPVQRQIENVAEDSKVVVLDLWAGKMREAKRNLCSAPANSRVRDREIEEIERLQRLYVKRAGERYDVPDCADL